MTDDQLFDRVIDTLRNHNDTVVIGVTDKEGCSRIYFSGKDGKLVQLIDAIQGAYLEDVMKDVSKPSDQDAIIQQFMEELDDILNEFREDEEDGKN